MFSASSSKKLLQIAILSHLYAYASCVSGHHPRLNNGLANTPPMGWNSYNHYSCSPNESIIVSNSQAIADLELDKLGYHYVTVDCGWTLPNRTKEGRLTWNPKLFPNGYPWLGDFIHSHGLGFGVYGDAGIQTCMAGSPAQAGSLSYEQTDADTFASWGADLVKYDNCYSDASLNYPVVSYAPSVSPKNNYVTMSEAVQAANRSMVFAICDWGVDFPSDWAPAIGHSWRITNDIIPNSFGTVARILNQAVPQTDFAGPDHWLDLDMLEVGNRVFTIAEEQTHFSLWAIIKSPLILGCALKDTFTSISDASLSIVRNKDVISYNQDSLGIAASFRRRWTEDRYEIWAGPLSGDRMVVALINNANFSRQLTLDFPVVGVQKVGWLKDIWNNVGLHDVLTSYTASVNAHGTILVELGDLTDAGIYNVSDAVSSNSGATTFTNVYGLTSSTNYTATITLAGGGSIIETVSLNASGSNTLIIPASTTNIVSLTLTEPPATFYPCTDFKPSSNARLTTCISGLCAPVSSKMAWLGGSESSTASLSIPSSGRGGTKFTEVYFCNNDIAFQTSWGDGTNTRNMTISINGRITRIEVPLSGRSSEIFSPGLGWQDTGVFGILLDGWAAAGDNEVVVGNVGNENGIVSWAADFVGMSVYW